MVKSSLLIGVLALHGDFTEHAKALEACGAPHHTVQGAAHAKLVKLPADLDGIKGLVIPGGESTTIGMLLQESGLGEAIIGRAKKGLSIYGTCAGAILLAKKITDHPHQYSLRLLDIEVDRNAYGRQKESFEATIVFQGKKIPVAFIRAPRFKNIGTDVKVLAKLNNEPVLVQQENILAGAFHPEITGTLAIHRYFLKMCS
jgi:5'-phosphate synthase pdxT subunit